MSDFVWFIITGVLFILLSLLFIMLGWQIAKRQKIDLIISYHHDKVSEENIRAYCILSGTAIIIIGIGYGISGMCTLFLQSAYVFLPMVTGLIIGTAMLIVAGIRYNHR